MGRYGEVLFMLELVLVEVLLLYVQAGPTIKPLLFWATITFHADELAQA